MYAQADLRLCWLHIPHCWKSHALAHFYLTLRMLGNFSCFCSPLLTFFQKLTFSKVLSGTLRVSNDLDLDQGQQNSVLIRVLTVYKGYQQMTKVNPSKKRVNPRHISALLND